MSFYSKLERELNMTTSEYSGHLHENKYREFDLVWGATACFSKCRWNVFYVVTNEVFTSAHIKEI